MRMHICLLFLIPSIFFASAAWSQEYGKLKALNQRAVFVTNQKNDFVTSVLTSYKIPHERNAQGIVVRINIEKTWHDVKAIEIVPVLRESADNSRRVAAHELYFFTDGGILNLISELTVR